MASTSRGASAQVQCPEHPDTPLVEDYHAGDMICSLCGLVVGDRLPSRPAQGVREEADESAQQKMGASRHLSEADIQLLNRYFSLKTQKAELNSAGESSAALKQEPPSSAKEHSQTRERSSRTRLHGSPSPSYSSRGLSTRKRERSPHSEERPAVPNRQCSPPKKRHRSYIRARECSTESTPHSRKHSQSSTNHFSLGRERSPHGRREPHRISPPRIHNDPNHSRGHSPCHTKGHSSHQLRGHFPHQSGRHSIHYSRGHSPCHSRGHSPQRSMRHSPDQSRGHSPHQSKVHSDSHHLSKGHSPHHSKGHSPQISRRRSPHHSKEQVSRGHSPRRSRRHSRDQSRGHSPHRSMGHSPDQSRRDSSHHFRGYSRHSRGHSSHYSRGHSPSHSRGHSPDQSKRHSPQRSREHSPHYSRENSPHNSRGHSPCHSRAHSPLHSRGHSPSHSRGHSPRHSRGHSPHQSKGHSLQRSREHSPHYSREHSPHTSRGHSPLHSRGPSPSHSGGHSPRHSRGYSPRRSRGHSPHYSKEHSSHGGSFISQENRLSSSSHVRDDYRSQMLDNSSRGVHFSSRTCDFAGSSSKGIDRSRLSPLKSGERYSERKREKFAQQIGECVLRLMTGCSTRQNPESSCRFDQDTEQEMNKHVSDLLRENPQPNMQKVEKHLLDFIRRKPSQNSRVSSPDQNRERTAPLKRDKMQKPIRKHNSSFCLSHGFRRVSLHRTIRKSSKLRPCSQGQFTPANGSMNCRKRRNRPCSKQRRARKKRQEKERLIKESRDPKTLSSDNLSLPQSELTQVKVEMDSSTVRKKISNTTQDHSLDKRGGTSVANDKEYYKRSREESLSMREKRHGKLNKLAEAQSEAWGIKQEKEMPTKEFRKSEILSSENLSLYHGESALVEVELGSPALREDTSSTTQSHFSKTNDGMSDGNNCDYSNQSREESLSMQEKGRKKTNDPGEAQSEAWRKTQEKERLTKESREPETLASDLLSLLGGELTQVEIEKDSFAIKENMSSSTQSHSLDMDFETPDENNGEYSNQSRERKCQNMKKQCFKEAVSKPNAGSNCSQLYGEHSGLFSKTVSKKLSSISHTGVKCGHERQNTTTAVQKKAHTTQVSNEFNLQQSKGHCNSVIKSTSQKRHTGPCCGCQRPNRPNPRKRLAWKRRNESINKPIGHEGVRQLSSKQSKVHFRPVINISSQKCHTGPCCGCKRPNRLCPRKRRARARREGRRSELTGHEDVAGNGPSLQHSGLNQVKIENEYSLGEGEGIFNPVGNHSVPLNRDAVEEQKIVPAVKEIIIDEPGKEKINEKQTFSNPGQQISKQTHAFQHVEMNHTSLMPKSSDEPPLGGEWYGAEELANLSLPVPHQTITNSVEIPRDLTSISCIEQLRYSDKCLSKKPQTSEHVKTTYVQDSSGCSNSLHTEEYIKSFVKMEDTQKILICQTSELTREFGEHDIPSNIMQPPEHNSMSNNNQCHPIDDTHDLGNGQNQSSQQEQANVERYMIEEASTLNMFTPTLMHEDKNQENDYWHEAVPIESANTPEVDRCLDVKPIDVVPRCSLSIPSVSRCSPESSTVKVPRRSPEKFSALMPRSSSESSTAKVSRRSPESSAARVSRCCTEKSSTRVSRRSPESSTARVPRRSPERSISNVSRGCLERSTARVSRHFLESSTVKVPRCSPENSTAIMQKRSTEKSSARVSRRCPESSTARVPRRSPERSMPNASRLSPERSIPSASRCSSEKSISRRYSERSTDRVSKHSPERSTAKMSRRSPERSSTRVSRGSPERSSTRVSRGSPERSSTRVSKGSPERSSKRSSTRVSRGSPEKSSARVSRRSPERYISSVSRGCSQRSTARVSRGSPERSSTRVSRGSPERSSERSSTRVSRGSPERSSARVSRGSPERSTSRVTKNNPGPMTCPPSMASNRQMSASAIILKEKLLLRLKEKQMGRPNFVEYLEKNHGIKLPAEWKAELEAEESENTNAYLFRQHKL